MNDAQYFKYKIDRNDVMYKQWTYAATMAGTFNVVNFHVFPSSAVDISPPVALYSHAPVCLKL
jgi:hypothetical protein